MTQWYLLMGCMVAMIAGKKPPAFSLYPAQRRNGALLLTLKCSSRHWLYLFAKAKCSLLLKTNGASERDLDNKTTDLTLHDSHPRRKNIALLLDFSIVNPYTSSNLENAAYHAGQTSR